MRSEFPNVGVPFELNNSESGFQINPLDVVSPLLAAVIELAQGKWIDAIRKSLGAVKAVRAREPTTAAIAGELVSASIAAAIIEVLAPHRSELQAPSADGTVETFSSALTTSPDDVIDEDALARPENLAIVRRMQNALLAWGPQIGLASETMQACARQFPRAFARAFVHAWSKQPAKYGRILESVKTPLAPAAARLRAWWRYRARLIGDVERHPLEPSMSLRSLYLWPFAWRNAPQGKGFSPQVVELRPHLDKWAEERNPLGALQLLAGDPGVGKSSFAKMFAAELALRGRHVLLVPLKDLRITNSFEETIREYVKARNELGEGPDPFDEEDLLVVLDGLDELEVQGGSLADAVAQLVKQASKAVRQSNKGADKARLQALLVGREIAVEAVSNSTAREHILHVLGFHPSHEDPDFYRYMAGRESWEAARQCETWWSLYQTATGQ